MCNLLIGMALTRHRRVSSLAGSLCAGVLWLHGSVAHAEATLDDLQRQLDQAQRARSAAKKTQAASVATGQKSAASASRDAQVSKLIVRSDVECDLRVNGEVKGKLDAGVSLKVSTVAGEQLIECRSTKATSVSASKIETIKAGEQAVVVLNLGNQVEGHDAIYRDAHGLEWQKSDNGADTNWSQARTYCQGLEGGWRLPSVSELETLIDAGLPGVPCGHSTCKVPAVFHLTGVLFWSSELDESSQAKYQAKYVGLVTGYSSQTAVDSSDNRRALCVHR